MTELTKLQKLVVKNYCNGDMDYIETQEMVTNCEDGLLVFIVNEMEDLELDVKGDREEADRRIERAAEQLQDLRHNLGLGEE